ncbi:tetraacyldisaccharide 4'-kinase [Xylophilus rhododendri]|uniref:Tetraacyldisaccharide 4'-kinase n=1 Tax=Xylophilus rhododendri TaxID=2697032 RepID=A0A857J0Y5_9BURK|nr:tetraacyldisaccharide 4'-kinase [Xylophilus rhododendri]QHI97257.1 tetraacyldisaccharide 4'-kinase [Xylophilus rhododendri]
MSGLAERLQAAWRRRGLTACLLWPLSLVYRAAWAWRLAGYRSGRRPSVKLPVPVVVVGNVIVGGAGKTPTVIALVQHLQSRGIAVGVVSRGYGRTLPPGDDDGGLEISAGSDPQHAGDEPLLIHRRTGVPVFVGRDRVESARRLLRAHPQVRLLVCDDGLQHLALARDIEVCVFDDRGVGNGWLLPAGPLREPWPRSVDLVLHTGQSPAFAGYRGERRLADHALRTDGSQVALATLAAMTGSRTRLIAIAGIARPQAFFTMLRERGLVLAETHALPDHADFTRDLPPIAADSTLLCTEKDAAKLWQQRPDALAVPLHFTLAADFLARLDRLVDAQLSSCVRVA